MNLNQNSKIFIAGHRGLVGSALVRVLRQAGFRNLLLRTHQECDLEDQEAVRRLFQSEKPDAVILAAAKVGGILANQNYPYDFLDKNLRIQMNVIGQAHQANVEHLVFLGSSCIYPRLAPQPITEEALLTGPLELTNRPYALAKIAGIEMCWSLNRQFGHRYFSVMPTNMYGIEDNFDLQGSHVLPALIRKFHEAKREAKSCVEVWGTGTPLREFLYNDDLAAAILFLLQGPGEKLEPLFNEKNPPLINVGFGSDLSIRELALLVKEVVGFQGEINFDSSKPDGTPRKLMDSSKIFSMGWRPRTELREGIQQVYQAVQTRF